MPAPRPLHPLPQPLRWAPEGTRASRAIPERSYRHPTPCGGGSRPLSFSPSRRGNELTPSAVRRSPASSVPTSDTFRTPTLRVGAGGPNHGDRPRRTPRRRVGQGARTSRLPPSLGYAGRMRPRRPHILASLALTAGSLLACSSDEGRTGDAVGGGGVSGNSGQSGAPAAGQAGGGATGGATGGEGGMAGGSGQGGAGGDGPPDCATEAACAAFRTPVGQGAGLPAPPSGGGEASGDGLLVKQPVPSFRWQL